MTKVNSFNDLEEHNLFIDPSCCFTAIDFETATSKNDYPCQLGIIVVENGVISKRISEYIRPPKNEYSQISISIHGITPDITKDKSDFSVVWNNVKQYIENRTVIAHNASFDISVLNKALEYHGINFPFIKEVICTKDLFNGYSLHDLCEYYKIDLPNHHDGLCDAEACANLYIKYVSEDIDTFDLRIKKESKQLSLFDDAFKESHVQIKGDLLKKDLSNADPSNPFYDRKIVVTGLFSIERLKLGKLLKSMGADINTTISKNTDYVLIGDAPGYKKIEKIKELKHNGFAIKEIYQSDLDNILSGKYEEYYVDKGANKDLDFTYSHYLKNKTEFNDHNIVASKELFYGKGFCGNFDIFNQITGNLGAFGDNTLYNDTNICVLSDSTIEQLKNGIKDETIIYIENFYNLNKSIKFNFLFLSENDILEFCKKRNDKFKDEITTDLYNKYLLV